MKIKRKFKTISIAIALFLVSNMLFVRYGKIQCNRMIDAIENNDITKLESILKFANPNCSTITIVKSMLTQEFRYTPLGKACKEGNFEMVKLLVENGADVNYIPWNANASPLRLAVQSKSSDNLKIVKFLVENGAVINRSQKNQMNPVSMALPVSGTPRPNAMEILKFLLEAGADSEKEALGSACYAKDEEAIRYLVEEWGYDASDPECIVLYCYGGGEYSYETFEYFLERGANPYEKYRINKFIGEKSAIECLREESPEWAEKLIELAASYGITE